MSVAGWFTGNIGQGAQSFATPVLTLASYQANSLMPVVIPNPDDALIANLAGIMDDFTRIDIWGKHGMLMGGWNENIWQVCGRPDRQHPAEIRTDFLGVQLTPWQAVARTKLYTPSIDECNVLLNRGLITDELHQYYVRKQVDNNKVMAEVWQDMRFEIPGPSDLVRFAVREAYNPELITLFGYNKEVPTQVLPWMAKQGYGGPTNLAIPPGGTDGDDNPRAGQATWLDLYWWSHWELPSLTQGYDMVHKLYPTSRYGPSPLVQGDTSFLPADLEKLQKAQDIPDYWRKKLQAISYNPIDKGDAEFMFENGIMSEADFYHNSRQKGQSDADAVFLLEAAKVRKMRNLGIDPAKQSLTYICKYYKLGIVTDQDAITMLSKLGWNRDDADAFLSKCKLELKGEIAEQLIHHIEQAFYRGLYSREQVEVELLRHNLNPSVVAYWLQLWDYKKAVKYKAISARQNLTAYQNGIITEPVLVNRLFNLGYDGNSVSIMVSNQKVQIQTKQNLALLKQQKQNLRNLKAASDERLKAEKRKLVKEKDDAKIITNKEAKRIRHIIKASSDANLKEWYHKQLIQLWEVFYRQYFKGFTIADADKWVRSKFPDENEENINASSKKAQAQFRSEGNYLE